MISTRSSRKSNCTYVPYVRTYGGLIQFNNVKMNTVSLSVISGKQARCSALPWLTLL